MYLICILSTDMYVLVCDIFSSCSAYSKLSNPGKAIFINVNIFVMVVHTLAHMMCIFCVVL